MSKMFMLGMVAAVAIAISGCCSMSDSQGSGGKCAVCGPGGKMACPHCKMMPGKCKCKMQAATMAEINTAALKALIDSGVSLTLVDARTGKYDDGRLIANAVTLSPEAKDEEIAAALKLKDAMIVSYCVNPQCPASRILAAKLMKLGYTRVLEYPQGIDGWVSEGNPVKQVVK